MDFKTLKLDWGTGVFIAIICIATMFYYFSDKKNNSVTSTITEIKNYEFSGHIDTIYLKPSIRYYPHVRLLDKDEYLDYPVTEKMFSEKKYRKGDLLVKKKGDSVVELYRNRKKIASYDYLLNMKNKGIIIDF